MPFIQSPPSPSFRKHSLNHFHARLLLLITQQGVLFPLVEDERPVPLVTDAQGMFIVDQPLDGMYKFSSDLKNSSCVDSLTGVPITFPMMQQLPASLAATVTAISLLTGPAKSDPAVRNLVSSWGFAVSC